ncbi:MAG: hypothetical protein N2Z60_06855, partial [Elusimicrobiales bacterium]|nr:hypothetical protein [Elusimicrobiales bacterium]
MFFNNHKELEDKIGYSFKDKKLLDKALTHKSYSVERKMIYHNERLEFLGDSVVGLIVSEHLLKKYLDKDEGFLSKMKSYIVSSKNLHRWAKIIELDKYIKLSKNPRLRVKVDVSSLGKLSYYSVLQKIMEVGSIKVFYGGKQDL